jgi:hypothetical protein
MKKIICSFFALGLILNVNAQDSDDNKKISFGLKAGLNSMHNREVTSSRDNVQKRSGVYAGIFVTIPASEMVSIQPELIYSSTEFNGTNNVNLLHVPLLLNFQLGNNFTGFVGPEGQILLNIEDAENQDLFNTFMFGFTFGAKYQITPNFYIEGRPYLALSRFLEDDLGYRKFNTLQIGLAYSF